MKTEQANLPNVDIENKKLLVGDKTNKTSKTSQVKAIKRTDSNSKKHNNRLKLCVASVLILAFSITGFSQLAVHDVKHMIQNGIEFGKNLKELNRHQAYRELMDGAWKDPMKLVKITNSTLAALGVDTSKLGWAGDNYRSEKAVKVASQSIDELQRIIKGDIKATENIAQTIQEVYGDIPVTRRGAQVRMAYETVSGVISNSGDTNKAVKEMLENSQKIQARLEDGNLVNGDRERLKGQQENLQLRSQILGVQQMNYNNQLQAQLLSMKGAQEAREEQERLRARSGMLGAFGAVAFSPAGKEIEGQE